MKKMKDRIETAYKFCLKIVKPIGISISLAAFFVLGVFLRGIIADRDMALWKSIVLTPEPEVCALCGSGSGISYHAPVVVNLSTGESGELRVYDPDPYRRNEIAEKQSTGTFSFLYVAGIMGYRDTCDHSSHVTLPKDREWTRIYPALFCHDCRALLADTATEGYVLADLYDLSDITTYSIKDGAKYTIRDYDISISAQEEPDGLSIHVTGLLTAKEG